MAYDAVRRRIGQYETILMPNKDTMTVGVLLDYNTVRDTFEIYGIEVCLTLITYILF